MRARVGQTARRGTPPVLDQRVGFSGGGADRGRGEMADAPGLGPGPFGGGGSTPLARTTVMSRDIEDEMSRDIVDSASPHGMAGSPSSGHVRAVSGMRRLVITSAGEPCRERGRETQLLEVRGWRSSGRRQRESC